jgi:ribose-phosphate pyrophosphokinase
MDRLKIFAGSSSKELGEQICLRLGIPLSPITIYPYDTGCFEVALDDNVRGCQVFIIQTAIPDQDLLHRHLWELFQMINAAKKSSAKEITVITPYLGYDRSDKTWRSHMSISGRLLVAFLEKAGMNRAVGINFHSSAFQGFFGTDIAVDHLSALPLLAHTLLQKQIPLKRAIVLPGDRGFEKEAEKFGQALEVPVGTVKKRRINSRKVTIESISGEISGKNVIIVDDAVCTAGTAVELANHLEKRKAKSITLATIHGLFSEKAPSRLSLSPISEIIVTDTVPIDPSKRKQIEKGASLTIVSIVPLLARAIREIYTGGSINRLFELSPEEY